MSKKSTDEQIYFNINQTAKTIGVVPATIRNWERQGLFTAKRTDNNYRVFDFNDIELMKKIKAYSSEDGMNMCIIKKLLSKETITSTHTEKKYYKKIYNTKLKEYREKQGYTLDDVSKVVGISPSYLSRIEQGHGNVSFEILDKLATFYGESSIYFFDIKSEQPHTLVKKGFGKSLGTALKGVQIESLIDSDNSPFETARFTVAPGAGDFKSHRHNSGEDFLYLLAGHLAVTLDDSEQYVLNTGDSIHFKSTRAHSWHNNSQDKSAQILWVHSYL